MSTWIKDGIPFVNPLVYGGRQIWNPTDEQLINAGYSREGTAQTPLPTIITKLKIRRAMRYLHIEEKLNTLLQASPTFATDWNDAQEINITDPVLVQALQAGNITEKEIYRIRVLAAKGI